MSDSQATPHAQRTAPILLDHFTVHDMSPVDLDAAHVRGWGNGPNRTTIIRHNKMLRMPAVGAILDKLGPMPEQSSTTMKQIRLRHKETWIANNVIWQKVQDFITSLSKIIGVPMGDDEVDALFEYDPPPPPSGPPSQGDDTTHYLLENVPPRSNAKSKKRTTARRTKRPPKELEPPSAEVSRTSLRTRAPIIEEFLQTHPDLAIVDGVDFVDQFVAWLAARFGLVASPMTMQ